MNTSITRTLGSPQVFWSQDGSPGGLSVEDVVSLLGKGTPRRGHSLARGIHNIPPYHALESDKKGKFTQKRTSYLGSLPTSPDRDQEPSPLRLAKLIRASVREIARKYQRVGLMLSGGFDSTLLAFLLKEAGVEVFTYTAESPGACGPKEWNFSRQVANSLGFPCTRIEVSSEHLESVRSKLLFGYPSPTICWVTGSQHRIAERALADGCQCLVSGIGSDEAFGGYHKSSRYAWRFGKYQDSFGPDLAWRALLDDKGGRRRLMSIGQCCPFPRYALKRLFPGAEVDTCLDQDVKDIYHDVWQSNPHTDITAAILQTELELRMADILLPELQAASQEFHITVEYPFLHPDVLSMAAQIPIAWKYRYGNCPELLRRPGTKAIDKLILRLAFQDILPGFVHDRPRNTFTLPFGFWLRQGDSLKKELDGILGSTLWRHCGADVTALPSLLKGTLTGDPWTLPFRIWVAGRLCAWWDSGGLDRLNKASLRF
jgi:asparagine synthetase B (glutamine-hydrolysing)